MSQPEEAPGEPGRFALDPAARLAETSPGEVPRLRQTVWESLAPNWDPSTRLLVENSPPNLLRTRLLAQLFPEARFIIIVRHPGPVALATRAMERPDRDLPLSEALSNWRAGYEAARQDERESPGIARYWLRYEDLVREPRRTMKDVLAFLELDAPQLAESVVDGNAPYRQAWASALPGLKDWDGLDSLRAAAAGFGYELSTIDGT